MSKTASPIAAQIGVDRFTSTAHLVEFASFEGQLDGSQPYVRVIRSDVSCAPADLLPEGATVERCVTTDNWVRLLARTDTATFHVEVTPRSTTVEIASSCDTRAFDLSEAIRAQIPEPPPGTLPVRIWHLDSAGTAVSHDRNIEAPRWCDIAGNYPQSMRQVLADLISLNRPAGTGKLVLWHGPPGTGKTTALRALLRAWAPWCQGQYITDPERFFATPGYMTEVLTAAPNAGEGPRLDQPPPETIWRLVIAEDTDEYLRSTARREAGAALGRLLNLADGILGQGMNVLVLLTTNEEITRLHPALIRPGRCLATTEFTLFDTHQASAWLDGESVDRPMTLAELLERQGALSTLDSAPAVANPTGQYL